MGAGAETVENEADIVPSLRRAMAHTGPYLLDVRIDASRPAPAMGRNRGLRALTGGRGHVPAISFPVTA